MNLIEIAGSAAHRLVERGIVGAVVGIRQIGGHYGEAAAGIADRESGQIIRSDAQFRIASITKTFVFSLVLKLHEEKRLDIDEPIARLLSDLSFSNRVTLRHILLQTGGLPVWATDRIAEVPSADGWSLREVIDFHYRMTPASAPGESMVYANVGSRLAGAIVEQAGAAPIADQMISAFLLPLRLDDTIASGAGAVSPPRLARGYAFDEVPGVADATFAVTKSWLYSGGDMYSTVADLTLWSEALFTGAVLGEEFTSALLSERVPGKFHGSTMSHHGLGVMFFERGGIEAVGYRGTTPGYVSILGFEPRSGTSVAVLTNCSSTDPQSVYRAGVEDALFEVLAEQAGTE